MLQVCLFSVLNCVRCFLLLLKNQRNRHCEASCVNNCTVTEQRPKATSTRIRFQINTVFKSLRFRKSPLSNPFSKVSVSGENGDFRKRWISVCVWTEGENEQKSLRFRMKTYTCGRGLRQSEVMSKTRTAVFYQYWWNNQLRDSNTDETTNCVTVILTKQPIAWQYYWWNNQSRDSTIDETTNRVTVLLMKQPIAWPYYWWNNQSCDGTTDETTNRVTVLLMKQPIAWPYYWWNNQSHAKKKQLANQIVYFFIFLYYKPIN